MIKNTIILNKSNVEELIKMDEVINSVETTLQMKPIVTSICRLRSIFTSTKIVKNVGEI